MFIDGKKTYKCYRIDWDKVTEQEDLKLILKMLVDRQQHKGIDLLIEEDEDLNKDIWFMKYLGKMKI